MICFVKNNTMKNLVEYINESMSKLHTEKISGKKYVDFSVKEYDIDEQFTSSNWHKTIIEPDNITVYWSEDVTWAFYYYNDDKVWAGVACPEGSFREDVFKDFEELCLNAATVPEFDKFETNLE